MSTNKRDELVIYLEEHPGTHRVRELSKELDMSEQWIQKMLGLFRQEPEVWVIERIGRGPATRWNIEKAGNES